MLTLQVCANTEADNTTVISSTQYEHSDAPNGWSGIDYDHSDDTGNDQEIVLLSNSALSDTEELQQDTIIDEESASQRLHAVLGADTTDYSHFNGQME